MEEIEARQILTGFIFDYPEVVAKILKSNGYALPQVLTLNNITRALFTALYVNQDKKLASEIDAAIADNGYSNVVGAIIAAVASIATAVIGANAAKKQREAEMKMHMAQLSHDKALRELEIRTMAETERTAILIQSLQQYQSDLQTQSTQRIKDVWIYVGMIGLSIAVILGTTMLIKPNK